jgi:hydroxyacylglutathione hydrolase
MGYDPIELVMKENRKPLTLQAFKTEVAMGALMLDTRMPDDFEKGFVPGALNIGLNGQYAVWVGTLIDIKQPLVLITEVGREDESILRLARVGYENVIGYLEGGVAAWDAKLEVIKSITAEQMKAEVNDGLMVLDVRKPSEWNISHVKDAVFTPLAEMPGNLSSFDKAKPYLVHCGGGYRSMMAISLMKRHGFKNLMNIYGGFGAMQQAGLEIVTEEVEV